MLSASWIRRSTEPSAKCATSSGAAGRGVPVWANRTVGKNRQQTQLARKCCMMDLLVDGRIPEEWRGWDCRRSLTARQRRLASGLAPHSIQFRRAAHGGIIRLQPLNHFHPVPIGIREEEPIGAGDQCRLLNRNSPAAEVGSGLLYVLHTQGEVPRTESIGALLQE